MPARHNFLIDDRLSNEPCQIGPCGLGKVLSCLRTYPGLDPLHFNPR